MLFVSPVLSATNAVIATGISIAKSPFKLMTSVRPAVIEVKVGLIHVGENVATRCIRELRLSYLSAPPSSNVRLKLVLVDKDFLEYFPVSQTDMFLVSRKLRRNILLGVGSWLKCEHSRVDSDRLTMVFTPRTLPFALSA